MTPGHLLCAAAALPLHGNQSARHAACSCVPFRLRPMRGPLIGWNRPGWCTQKQHMRTRVRHACAHTRWCFRMSVRHSPALPTMMRMKLHVHHCTRPSGRRAASPTQQHCQGLVPLLSSAYTCLCRPSHVWYVCARQHQLQHQQNHLQAQHRHSASMTRAALAQPATRSVPHQLRSTHRQP
jgi:hypothetical protein